MTDLLVERRDAVAVLTLNRPTARNALTSNLATALTDALNSAERDDDIRVVVLTGSGSAFCAGLDLTEFSAPDAPRHVVGAAINRVQSFGKPLIGAINGPAVTGGLELALACDTLIASPAAAFRDTHLKIGALSGTGVAVHLPRAVGGGWARRMALSGDVLGADVALQLGFVTEIVSPQDLVQRACELAERMAAMDPTLARTVKKLYQKITSQQAAEGLALEREALMNQREHRSGWRVDR